MKGYNNNMDQDLSELIQHIDDRFNKIEIKLEQIIENKADKADVRSLAEAVDAYAKKADAYFQEMVMMSHKVERLEKWLHQVAEKIGIKLEY